MLILEGAQAGLSWDTILKKREGYRRAFKNFDPIKVKKMTDLELEELRLSPEIIRNRLKIYSTRLNAAIFIDIQAEFGSFDKYIWNFVKHSPIVNTWNSINEIPVTTEISDALSKDLKKRGMKFVGSTIIYAYMQAIGMANDHLIYCWKAKVNNS
jgi:DNA-3-methyladenine glycosylase I